jgi:hypothetical protein
VILASCLGNGAHAQGIESTPETVVFSVEGGARFEDNRDATRNNKESMLSLRFTPGARLNVDDEITKFFLVYKPSLLWRDNPREDQNDTELYHMAEANAEHWVSHRLKVGAWNRYEMTDDPNVTGGGVTIRENASYWLNQSKAWVAYGLSERLQADADVLYLVKRYDEDAFSDVADEDRLLVNTGLRYKLDPEFHAFGFIGYDQPEYSTDIRGDYKGYLAGLGLSRDFSDALKGSVAAGYKHLNYDDAEESDTGMPFGQISGEYRVSVNLRLQALVEYTLAPSDRSYYSSKEYTRFQLKGIYQVSDSLTADAQVVYSNGAYDKSSVIVEREELDQVLVDGDDTLMDYQIGVTFRPKARRYYGRVAYEFEDWTSDVRESFARNTVSAQVGIEF